MNERLQKFAREEILKDLKQCTGAQRRMFAIMYMVREMGALPADVKEDITDEDLKIVVDAIPVNGLSWAMEQTRNTVLKKSK